MNLIPEFKIGLLNAWLGAAPILVAGLIFMVANKKAGKRAIDMSWYSTKEKIMAWPCMLGYYGTILYSITVPLKLGTIWFYSGLIVYIAGMIPLIVAYFNYAAAPLDAPIVKGIYRISRNPLYFFTVLALFGLSIASASWVMLLLVILYNIFQHAIILGEERFCLEKYGETYGEYMNNVPRYLFIW